MIQVVLADGSIVKANQNENTDLYWALKGGGPNYGNYPPILLKLCSTADSLILPDSGIVTKIELMAVPNKVWAEARVYPPTANPQLLEAVMQYHGAIEKDNKSTLIWHSTDQATLLVYFYCDPVEKPDVFKPFYDIPFLMNVVPPGIRTVYEMVQAVANVLTAEEQG